MADSVTLTAGEYAQLRTMLDKQAIAECQARIARGADRFDKAMYLSACHPDAKVSVGGYLSTAEESFDGGKQGHSEATVSTNHCLSTTNIDIAGDVAHAETYHIYTARTKAGLCWAATGRYLDQFERRDGKWGLVFRHISVEWAGQMTEMDLPLMEAPDAPKHRLSASRDAADVSYLRPLAG